MRGGELLLLHRPTHDADELVALEGFLYKIEGPGLHRRDRVVDAAVGGHEDHGQSGAGLQKRVEQFQAVHLRHHEVGDDGGERVFLDHFEGELAVGGDDDGVARPLERGADRVAHHLLVIDDEDFLGHGSTGFRRGLGEG